MAGEVLLLEGGRGHGALLLEHRRSRPRGRARIVALDFRPNSLKCFNVSSLRSQADRTVLDSRTTSSLENVKRFRGGLVCKAHRLLHHSTLGSRVGKMKKDRIA